MFKKYLTLALTILTANLFLGVSINAQTQNDRDSRLVLNVKNTVAGVGTEPNRKIKITLKDGTKLKGYITEIKDDYFALLDTKSGKVTSVQYSQVVEAKRDGLSRFAKSLIASGVGFGLIFIPIFVALATAKD
ncbi:MAG: hypothetical protein ACR2N3_03250 [Pyrinomonadaceae bacterium]